MRAKSPQIAFYRLFDLADEIDLSRLAGERLKLLRGRSGAVQFEHPPVTLDLGVHRVGTQEGQLSARLYDFGVAALRWRVASGGDRTWEELGTRLDELGDDPELDRLFEREVRALEQQIEPALLHPVEERRVEEFAVVLASGWANDSPDDRVPAARTLLGDPDVPGLVLGEARPLSDEVRRELDRFAFSYSRDDLAVLGFDRVLIVDPEEIWDVADLVELAHAELIELQFYDRVLDREIADLPRLLARRAGFLGLGNQKLRRRLMQRLAEITDVRNRLRRALTVTEDLFYAKVYRTSMSLYGATEIAETLSSKGEVLSNVYDMLTGEVNALRTEALELGIFLLVLIEVVKAFL